MFDTNSASVANPLIGYLSHEDIAWNGFRIAITTQINAFGIPDGFQISWDTDKGEYSLFAMPVIRDDEVLISCWIKWEPFKPLSDNHLLPLNVTHANFTKMIQLLVRKIKRHYILQMTQNEFKQKDV